MLAAIADDDAVRGGGAAHQLAGRNHGRVGGALRLAAGGGGEEAGGGGALARSRPRAATSRRSATDHIVARGNTLTGSIGVIMEYPDLTAGDGADRRRAWRRCARRRSRPSPRRSARPARRRGRSRKRWSPRATSWFRGLVAERRGLEGAALDAVANGAVFTGRLALDNGLVDEIGGEPEGIAWLESRDPSLDGLPVRDWEVERDKSLRRLDPRQAWAQAAGFSGKYRSGRRPSSIPSLPESCQYGGAWGATPSAATTAGDEHGGAGCRR